MHRFRDINSYRRWFHWLILRFQDSFGGATRRFTKLLARLSDSPHLLFHGSFPLCSISKTFIRGPVPTVLLFLVSFVFGAGCRLFVRGSTEDAERWEQHSKPAFWIANRPGTEPRTTGNTWIWRPSSWLSPRPCTTLEQLLCANSCNFPCRPPSSASYLVLAAIALIIGNYVRAGSDGSGQGGSIAPLLLVPALPYRPMTMAASRCNLPIVIGKPIPFLYVELDGTAVPVVKKGTVGRAGKTEGQPARTREPEAMGTPLAAHDGRGNRGISRRPCSTSWPSRVTS